MGGAKSMRVDVRCRSVPTRSRRRLPPAASVKTSSSLKLNRPDRRPPAARTGGRHPRPGPAFCVARLGRPPRPSMLGGERAAPRLAGQRARVAECRRAHFDDPCGGKARRMWGLHPCRRRVPRRGHRTPTTRRPPLKRSSSKASGSWPSCVERGENWRGRLTCLLNLYKKIEPYGSREPSVSDQPRDWDKELAAIDRVMAKGGGTPLGRSRHGGVDAERGAQPAAVRRVTTWAGRFSGYRPWRLRRRGARTTAADSA